MTSEGTEKHFVLFTWEIKDYVGVVLSIVCKWGIAWLKSIGLKELRN